MFTQLDVFNKNILYKDDVHSYELKSNGRLLTSVTTVLKQYSPEFRKDYWLMYKCLQKSNYIVKSDASRGVQKDHIVINGVPFLYTDVLGGESGVTLTTTPFQLGQEWDRLALIGNTRGSIVHDYLENAWRGKIYPDREWRNLFNIQYHHKFNESIIYLKGMARSFLYDYRHLIPLSLEQIVGCPNYMVAGQIDALLHDPNTQKYYLYDYKTDKEIKYDNPFQSFKAPLSHIEDCNFNKYSLQLGMYKHLLEKWTKIKIEGIKIVWFNKDNSNYQVFDLNNYDAEITNLFEHHTNRHLQWQQ